MIKVNNKILPDNFTVAVSGGVDSISAAHLLWRMGYNITVAHYNHNYQSCNREMMESVMDFCEDHKIKLYLEEREWRHIPDIGGNVEAVLRESRMKFFRSLNQHIICCHHLDDAVEQYFLNFLRGCPEYIPIRWETLLKDSNKSILHPFLATVKEDFETYAENNDLMKYVVEDPTNKDNSFRRNWTRNEILPQFKEFGLRKIVRKKYYL